MPKPHLSLDSDVTLSYWHQLSHVMREMITFRSESTSKNLNVDGHLMDLTSEEQRKLTF